MLALVGDYQPSVTAHVAIPRALELARQKVGADLSWEWVRTDAIGDPRATFRGATGVWVVPASPYASMAGALAAIRHAREQRLPFLGTCGGFQHALIEFARNVAGIPDADHAETAGIATTEAQLDGPGSTTASGVAQPGGLSSTTASGVAQPGGLRSPAAPPPLIITALACSLVEKSDAISFTPGSRLHDLFGGQPTTEGYHCSYGVNPDYRARLETAGLRFTGFDAQGDIRACEYPSHPFFVGTLFQPERSALRGISHPLITAFVRALARQ